MLYYSFDTFPGNPIEIDPTTISWVFGATNNGASFIGPTNQDTVFVTGSAWICFFAYDTSGCEICNGFYFLPTSLAVPPGLTSTVTPGCPGGGGAIDVTMNSGWPPYTFLWSNGATTEDLSNVPPGPYGLYVTGSNGCDDWFNFDVPALAELSLSANAQPNTACNPPNGAISLSVTSSNPAPGPFSFLWSNGGNSQNPAGLPAGDYTVTVTEAGGCSATASFTVTEDLPPPPGISAAVTPSFCGLPNGAIDLSLSGGAAPFTFNWATGANTEDLDGLPPGDYLLTITDVAGCTATASINVPEDAAGFSLAGAPVPNSSCAQPNGGVTLSVSPASLPPPATYQFAWSNGGNSQNLEGATGGAYTVTVTAGACTESTLFQVGDATFPPGLDLAASPASCGQNNGAISLTVTSGNAPFTFAWSNGDSQQDIAGLPPGPYSVTVTGSEGCTASASATVEDSPGLTDTILVNASTCDPAAAGVFTEILTNSAGCDSTVVMTVTFAESDTTLLSSTTCDPAAAGVFTQNLTGADGCDSTVIETVTLLESDSVAVFETTCDPSGVGVFIEILTNSAGCDSVVVTTVAFAESDTTLVSSTTCDPASAGVFTQNLTGTDGCDSTVIETVSLLESDSVFIFSTTCDPAQTGVFTEIFTNSVGCDSTVVTTVAFAESDTTLLASATCDPSLAGVFTQNLTGADGCDSTVIETVALLAGDTVQVNSSTCDPAGVGVFTEIFTNQNGCDSTVIEMVTLLESDSVAVFETTCDPSGVGVFTEIFTNSAGCDSTVVTTVAFAESDTTLLASTTCDPAAAGVFTQNLTGADGCDSTVIETVTLLAGDSVAVLETTCDPAGVGVFSQILTNSVGCDSVVVTTVTFAESDTTLLASTTCDPAAAGVFTQNLSGADGCDSTVIETVALLAGDSVAVLETTCDPAGVGVFSQILTNSVGCDSVVVTTVTFAESDTTLLASTTCDPAAAGVFTQNFTNQNGCDSVVIETVLLLESDSVFLNSTTCDLAAAGVFTEIFTNQNGCDSTVIETVALLESDSVFIASTTCDPTMAGVFTEILTNSAGCDSVVATEILWSPQPVLALMATDFNGFGVSCDGGMDGAVGAAATGNGSFVFLWSNGGTGPSLEGLQAGLYGLTVTDANGCTATAQAGLTQPPALEVAFAVNDPDCFGQDDGAVFVEPLGGAPPYRYSLGGADFQESNAFTGLSAGTYEVTVQDANGCEAAEVIWINAPLPVNVELGDDQEIGFGQTATLTALVNVPFDSLAFVTWSPLDSAECPGCLSQPVSPLVTTAYSVTVTAANGCSDSDGVTVFVDRRKQVYVPNAFSPNGDGVNDEFLIFSKPNTVKTVRSFQVFSRWGESVHRYFDFHPDDPAHGWDGSHRGVEMNAGVFVWFAEVEFVDGEVVLFEGEVVLVR